MKVCTDVAHTKISAQFHNTTCFFYFDSKDSFKMINQSAIKLANRKVRFTKILKKALLSSKKQSPELNLEAKTHIHINIITVRRINDNRYLVSGEVLSRNE